MKRFSSTEIQAEINNGNEEILVYLARKFFPSARKHLRIRGFRDAETPALFSEVMARIYSNLSAQDDNRYVDFESYFMNALNEFIREKKDERKGKIVSSVIPDPVEIASRCVSVLDEQSQKILFARVGEKLSYEELAQRFQFSNAVIAQYEAGKAFQQLEGIVRLRLNISRN